MNLNQFRAVAPTIDKEIAAVFEKFGLKVGKRSATVDETTGTVNFRLALVDTNLKDKSGNATTPEAERYKTQAHYLGLDPAWLGQTFKRGNKTCKVVGLRAGRTMKPVFVEIDGKSNYIFDVATIRAAFGKPKDVSIDELRQIAVG